MTDKELITLCKNGNRLAQRDLFNKFAPKMYVICLRYARHRLEAEDIMQDAFIKVYKNLDQFQFKGSFEGWIKRIMINTALKNYNKSSFQKEQIGIHESYNESTSAKAYSNLGQTELLNLVNELPNGYKLVFNLYAIEGFKHKEIAEVLNIDEGTSRSQLLKARKVLQQRIVELEKISL